MGRRSSRAAVADAATETDAAAAAEAVDTATTILQDLAERAVAAAESTSAALADASEQIAPPRRRRRRLRRVVLLAGIGGAGYAAVKTGLIAKVRSKISGGGGGDEPPQDEAGIPLPSAPAAEMSVPGVPTDGEEAGSPVGVSASTNGTAPERAAATDSVPGD